MRTLVYAFVPLAVLVIVISLAGVISFGLLQLTGDVQPIEKIIPKVTEALLILSIFPLRKYLHFNWADLGFAPYKIFAKQLYQGLALSLITLLPIMFTLYALDIQIYDETQHWTAAKLAGKISLELLLALLIALGEEILFRGLLLTSLRQKFKVFTAIALCSMYFASLHFLKSKTSIPYADLTITSSFHLMFEAFGNWFNPEAINPLLALFVVGVFLATLRTQVPQSLALCIGCHCGWVWQIKVCKDLLNINPQSNYLFLVSTNYDGVVGPLVGVWLSIAIVCYVIYQRYINTSKQPL